MRALGGEAGIIGVRRWMGRMGREDKVGARGDGGRRSGRGGKGRGRGSPEGWDGRGRGAVRGGLGGICPVRIRVAA